MSRKQISLLFIALVLIAGCKKDTDEPVKPAEHKFGSGVYISCEGPFMSGTGSVSFYNRQKGTMENEIFLKENSRPPGNIVQSINIFGNRAYIVVNNAAKVEVVDVNSFKSVAVINGLTSPRYFIGQNTAKGYISDWSNHVHVINLTNNSVISSISTGGIGPERMLISGNKLFVLNAGGWGVDNLLSVIDTGNDNITDTIRIGDRPTGIVKDNDNMIWIMCSGKGFNGWPQADDTKGRLIKLDPSSLNILESFEFPASDMHPEHLCVNKAGDKLYYLYPGGIYEMSINAISLPSTPFIPSSRAFYSLAYDTVSEKIFVSDPGDFSQNGWVFRYEPTNKSLIDSLMVGVIPGNFFFN